MKISKLTLVNYRGDYLVMIGEWDDGGTHPQDHGGVDLTVGVGGAVLDVLVREVVRGHGQHDGFLLQGVNVFYHSTGHQVLPTVTQIRTIQSLTQIRTIQ